MLEKEKIRKYFPKNQMQQMWMFFVCVHLNCYFALHETFWVHCWLTISSNSQIWFTNECETFYKCLVRTFINSFNSTNCAKKCFPLSFSKILSSTENGLEKSKYKKRNSDKISISYPKIYNHKHHFPKFLFVEVLKRLNVFYVMIYGIISTSMSQCVQNLVLFWSIQDMWIIQHQIGWNRRIWNFLLAKT